MIKVSVYKNAQDLINGFKVTGHAEYDDYGKDIVCSAVSVLVINTINSIHKFTADSFSANTDENDGFVEFHLNHEASEGTNLLLDSLVLGLEGIQNSYSKEFLEVNYIMTN